MSTSLSGPAVSRAVGPNNGQAGDAEALDQHDLVRFQQVQGGGAAHRRIMPHRRASVEAFEPRDRFGNMFKVILDPLRVHHSGAACARTRARNFGGNPLGVSTETLTPSNSSASL